MCETIDDKILASIKKCGRGTVFFGSDYIMYGTRSAVNKTLERMARDGVIIRVARKDGAGRSIETADGVQIKFKHASPRYFTMKDMQACLISTALKDWKIENLTEEQIERLRKIVVEHGEYPVEELKLMPSAARELVMSFLK